MNAQNQQTKHAQDTALHSHGSQLMDNLMNRVAGQVWQGLAPLHDASACSVQQLYVAARELYSFVNVFGTVPAMETYYRTIGADTIQATDELLVLKSSWNERPQPVVTPEEEVEYMQIGDGYRLCAERFQTCAQQTLLEMTAVTTTLSEIVREFPGDIADDAYRAEVLKRLNERVTPGYVAQQIAEMVEIEPVAEAAESTQTPDAN